MRKLFLLLVLFAPLMLASCGDDDNNGTPADTTDPEVTLLAPQNGESVIAEDVLIQAQATDNRGIATVEFYVDGTKIGEDATGTAHVYEYTWDASGLNAGSGHTIRVRAIDTSDNDDEATIAVAIVNSGMTIHNQDIVADETWDPSGNPHVVTLPIHIGGGATLTISPGCHVEFQPDVNAGLNVGWEPEEGALVAVGNPLQPISFSSRAAVPQRGDWHGLYFFGGTLPTTHLSYCTIEYTGYNESAAAYVAWGAVVALDHCTIRQGAGPGVSYEHGGHVDHFDFNTITTCAGNALETEPEFVRYLGAGTSFTGNDAGKDRILLQDGVMVTSGTWHNQGVPYEIAPVNAGGGILVAATEGTPAVLTIDAGTTIRFSSGAQLAVGSGGSTGGLIAVGTELLPITFTSAALNPTPGDWHQIALEDGAQDGQCQLEHCVIEYGGGANYGNLSIVDARPTVAGCSIGHGASYGIFLGGNEYPDAGALEANNAFYDNAGANVFVAEP